MIIDFKERTISSETKFTGNIINLRVDQIKLYDGQQGTREIVEHSGGATIIPQLSEEKIIMVRQYRKAAEEVMLELPAGKLEENEDPRQCVRRELIEETGYQARKIKKLFSFYTSPGYSSELLHLYCGQDLKFVGENPDQGELIETEVIARDQIMDLITSGKIKDSKTIIGLLYVLRKGF
ncbi:MAG: NUDIX hydrolase [Halanaerobiaceae bacterium]